MWNLGILLPTTYVRGVLVLYAYVTPLESSYCDYYLILFDIHLMVVAISELY